MRTRLRFAAHGHLLACPPMLFAVAMFLLIWSQEAGALTTTVPATVYKSTWLAADGSILTLTNSKSQTVPAAGSIGIMHYAPGRVNDHDQLQTGEQFSLFFSVAGTSDTVSGSSERDFASSLLPATVNGHRPSVQLDYYAYRNYSHRNPARLDQQWGIRAYGGLARTTWSADSMGTTFVSDVVLANGGLRLVWVPIRQRLASESSPADTKISAEKDATTGFVSVTVEGGVTGRYLFFDDVNGERMRSFALHGEKRFMGGEIGIALQVRDFVASMYLPMFWKDTEIPGLTGAHPQFQFSVQTRFIKISADQ